MLKADFKTFLAASILLLSPAIAFSGAIDVVFSQSFGTMNTKVPGSFNYPSGIAVNSATGDIYVMDQLFGRIQRFDAAGNYIQEWPAVGIGIAVDEADGSVYLASENNSNVVKYSATGQTIFTLGSLGSQPGNFNSPKDVAVNPVTRNFYVADTNNNRIQEFTSAGAFVRQFTYANFNKVYGVAVDPTGQFIYVSDAGLVRIHKFDANGNHLLQWSSVGNGPGQLRWPRGIAVTPNGDVLVSSTDNHEVVRFDANGNFLQSIRGPNTANTGVGGFHTRAVDVNRLTGEILAPASYSHRIDRFDAAGTYLSSWGTSDINGYHLNRANGIAIDPVSGDIFLADNWNNLYKRFSSAGVFETQWGTGLDCGIKSDETTVNFPSVITVDALGNAWTLNNATYYVDDKVRWSEKYVRRYNLDGGHTDSFGTTTDLGLKNGMNGIAADPENQEVYVVNTPGHKILVFSYNGVLLRQFGAFGSGPGQFSAPAGIALDAAHQTLFIIDSGNQRVQKLDTKGNFILSFGSAGSGANGVFNLDSHSSLALDDYGHVLVTDTNNSRIQMFDLDGNFLKAFGSNGTGNDNFKFPTGIASNGTAIAVSDTYNFRVQLYTIVPLPDQDNDNRTDSTDNCPVVANFNQTDQDGDGVGNACDNCSSLSNPSQSNADSDGAGDACDADDDNDGLHDILEATLGTNPLLADSDNDGLTDYAEVAYDGDPYNYAPGVDLNPFTADTDGDGLLDGADASPFTYNADTVWLEDSTPAGATRIGTWTFTSTNPAPYSGNFGHQSTLAAGIHQHYFQNAASTLVVNSGDILFTYVYLDPANVPAEVMLQWREGSNWNHRAYWGANRIDWGVNGTASRYYMGPLPAAGGWVRLEVPASAVGLEGRIVNGMAFTLFDGRATWDYAGKSTMPLLPRLQFSASNNTASESSGSATLTVTRNGNTGTAISVDYTTADNTATAGSDYTTTSGTLNFAPWEASKTITVPVADDAAADGGESFKVTLSSPQNATLGGVSVTTVTIADNEHSISGQVTLDGAPLSNVKFTATGGATCTVTAETYQCTVPTGWSGTVFANLPGFRFSPSWRSYTSAATDMQGQNFESALQADTVWVEDAAPSGSTKVGTWNFIGTNPAPFSGALAHQEPLATGTHQHYFYSNTSTMPVNAGDVLFTYVYLDPANPPTEVLLQWREGSSWEHRAYWGNNSIAWGTNATASRYPMGPLPPAGGWVRLEVPANLVGLEGKAVNGMAFALYGGSATWDYAGKGAAPLPPQLQFNANSYAITENGGLATLTVTRSGNNSTAVSVDYATTDGTATAGADYTTAGGTLNFAPWETSKTITVPVLDDAIADGSETLTVTLSNAMNATVGSIGTATVTIQDNESSISGQITLGSAPLSGVSLTASNGGTCTASDGAGMYRCTVSPGWSGTIAPSYAGYWFNSSSRSYSNITTDTPAQNYTAAVQQAETVWLNDALPAGAASVGTWNFTNANPAPFSGTLAHQEASAPGIHQHYFYGTSNTLSVSTGNILFAYVYLDSEHPPSEIMLQWREGSSWDHRAYWGANKIDWGAAGTASRTYMGPLPPAGGWYRLEIPASAVGLEGKVLNGMAFTLYDGKATWDYAGKQ